MISNLEHERVASDEDVELAVSGPGHTPPLLGHERCERDQLQLKVRLPADADALLSA